MGVIDFNLFASKIMFSVNTELFYREKWRLALWAAEVDVQLSLTEGRGEKLRAAAVELRRRRKQLFGMIDWVWPGDEQMQSMLQTLRQGQGYIDLANDGLGLSEKFTERIKEAETHVNPKELSAVFEQTRLLSSQVMELRQAPKEPNDLSEVTELRNRVYSLFHNLYNEIARAGRYLYGEKDEARVEAYAPLYRVYLRRVRQNPSLSSSSTTETQSESQ